MMAKQNSENEMPFLEHLEELRWRIIRSLIAIIVGTILGLIFAKKTLALLIWPTTHLNPPLQLQVLKVQGMFVVTLEVGFFSGLVLSIPYIFYQLWKFISPGLLEREKRYFPQLLGSVTLLFLAGICFAYFLVLPFAIKFFIGLAPPSIAANIAIDFYISFVIRILLLFGLVFELPVLSFFLSKIGILSPEMMKSYRRHAIVGIFILAAILTPPDPFTQILLAVPLIILYEISIVISRFAYTEKEETVEPEYEPDEGE